MSQKITFTSQHIRKKHSLRTCFLQLRNHKSSIWLRSAFLLINIGWVLQYHKKARYLKTTLLHSTSHSKIVLESIIHPLKSFKNRIEWCLDFTFKVLKNHCQKPLFTWFGVRTLRSAFSRDLLECPGGGTALLTFTPISCHHMTGLYAARCSFISAFKE